MADCYLRSTDGLDADGGTTWALAKATLAAALTTAGAGGRVFMSKAHAETTAGPLTETSPGTSTSTTAVLCVDDTGSPEPPTALSTLGSVSTTGSNAIAYNGHAAAYGFTTNASNSTGTANINFISSTSWHWIFRSCVLVCRGTNSSNRIQVTGTTSANESFLELLATDVQFNAVAQAFTPGGLMKWYGGTLTLGTAPTGGLVKGVSGGSILFEWRGVDLTNLGTNPLLEVSQGVPGGYFDLMNCKLNSSYAVTNITTGSYDGLGHARVRLHQCTGSDTNRTFNLFEKDHAGTVEHETTIFRNGGASDGTAPYSHKMTAGSNSYYAPLWSPRYAIPIFTVGSAVTITIEVFRDAASAPKDDEVWAELEYLGTSGNTLSTITDTRRAIFGTAATLTTSSATWAGSSANPKPCSITINFTPREVGVAFVRVAWALGSANILYIDPPQRAQVV